MNVVHIRAIHLRWNIDVIRVIDVVIQLDVCDVVRIGSRVFVVVSVQSSVFTFDYDAAVNGVRGPRCWVHRHWVNLCYDRAHGTLFGATYDIFAAS